MNNSRTKNDLRTLFEEVIVAFAFIGYFELEPRSTYARRLKHESTGQEVFVSVCDNGEYAENPIIIRFSDGGNTNE